MGIRFKRSYGENNSQGGKLENNPSDQVVLAGEFQASKKRKQGTRRLEGRWLEMQRKKAAAESYKKSLGPFLILHNDEPLGNAFCQATQE